MIPIIDFDIMKTRSPKGMVIVWKKWKSLQIGTKIICFGMLSTLISCSWNEPSVSNKIVLRVDSQEMSSKQFADELAHRLSKYDALTAKDSKMVTHTKEAIVNDFVMSSVLESWAKKNNLQVSKEALDAEIKSIRSGFPDDFSFREELSRQGLSVNQWQKTVESRLLEKAAFEHLQKLKVTEPTEDSIKKFYEANKKKYKSQDKIYLQQIVLADKADADKMMAAIKAGKSIESLAKQFSIAPEGKNGGVVGWIERGTLEVFDKAFSLPIGVPSDIIQSPYGFHILIVQKKLPAGVAPLSAVHDSIKRELASQNDQIHFKTWLSEQVRSLHVFKDQQLIDTMSVETRKE